MKSILSGGVLGVVLLCLFVRDINAREPLGNKGLIFRQSTLRGRIIEINEDYRFVVINLGSADGVKQGMFLNVFQRDEEAARIKVSKVRRHISACDIQLVYTGRAIGVGDIVVLKQPSVLKRILRPLEPTATIEIEPIVVDIDAPKRTILKKTLRVFKEFGAVITESNAREYTLLAHKNVALPLDIALLTDWGANVRNKVDYKVEITSTPRFNRLIIRLRGVYDQEGQTYNHQLKKTSYVYKEAQEMAFTIKDLAEQL